MKKKVLRILNIVLDVFLVLFMIFSAFTLVTSLSQNKEEQGGELSHVFGLSFRCVLSESMEAYDENGKLVEGGFKKGDMIICKAPEDNATYEVGDIVTFWMPVKEGGYQCDPLDAEELKLTTHQIVEIAKNEDGTTAYITKGLNDTGRDHLSKRPNEIKAVYTGKRIPLVGSIVDFVQSPDGILYCLVLPILAFVIIQAIRVIRNFVAYKSQKAMVAAASGELTEEQKRLIAEEYLKSQNTSNSPEAAPEKKPEETEETSSEETSDEAPEQTQE